MCAEPPSEARVPIAWVPIFSTQQVGTDPNLNDWSELQSSFSGIPAWFRD
jgi:hypothetical protein